MALLEKDRKKIIDYVKKEPRTVQDIARLIGKSWLTADAYVQKIRQDTGLIDLKTFRAGTQGALKLVFYASPDSLSSDDVKESILFQIKNGREKTDFDFMELYQFVPEKKKKSFIEEYDDESVSKKQQMLSLFENAESQIFVFSGNLSFLNMREGKKRIIDAIEDALRRKVKVKILCRVNFASVSNISKLSQLISKYPGQIEIKHRYQPLRGFLIDGKLARFKEEEQLRKYKEGELEKNTRIFYEIYDPDWLNWIEKIFWNLFRGSIDFDARLREMRKIF